MVLDSESRCSHSPKNLREPCARHLVFIFSQRNYSRHFGSHRIYLGHVGRYPSPHVTLETTVRKGESSREKTSSERRMSTDLREPDLRNNAKRAAGRDSITVSEKGSGIVRGEQGPGRSDTKRGYPCKIPSGGGVGHLPKMRIHSRRVRQSGST